jgi:hypothetical protein
VEADGDDRDDQQVVGQVNEELAAEITENTERRQGPADRRG